MKLSEAYMFIIAMNKAYSKKTINPIDKELSKEIIRKYSILLEEIEVGKQKDYEIGGFRNENNTKSNE